MTPTRSSQAALVDCVVVVAAVGLVLTLLDESFWARDYLVAGMAPVVFLLVLAWSVRRLADGVWIYCLGSLLAYAPLGALAALHRPGPWIVPTFETMNRVLGETFTAPQLFVNTLPPVDASGTLLLLPYAIGFGAAAPAAWLALATSRPLAPALSILGGLAATILVSVLVPDYYILRGVLLTVLLVSWASVRARRAESLVGQRRSGVVGALAVVVVVAVVSGLAGLLVPDNDQTDRVRLDPTGEGVVAEAADTVVPTGAGRVELMRADGVPDGRRLRFGVLDEYDGQAWVPAEQSPGAGPAGTFRRINRVVEPLTNGPEVEVRVRVRPGYASSWLPMLGELTRIDLDYTDGRTQLDDIRYNQATSSAVVVGGVDGRDDYTFTSVVTPTDFSGTDEAMVATEGQRQPEGAFLDPFLVPFDRAELEPLQRVLLMARYLRANGEVRLTGTSSQDPVDLGLRLLGAERITGTPFQYSAVTALGASRLGVPARVVVGAAPDARGIVAQRDVLSWVELQLADGTWRTLEPDRYTGVHAPADEADDERSGAGGWVQTELDLDKDQIKIPKGADIELSPDAVLEDESDTWAVVGGIALGLAALVLLALLLVPFAKVVRRRRRTAGGWSSIYVNGWQEVLDAARDRGTPVPDVWGRVAQAKQLGTGLDLARRADAAVFAPGPGDAEDGREFWRGCLDLRGELIAQTDGRSRWWAVFNPASLLAGWARNRATKRSGHVRDEDRGPRRQHAARA